MGLNKLFKPSLPVEQLGKYFEVENEYSSAGTIKIISQSGEEVYTNKFDETESIVWKGESKYGQVMSLGIYTYVISFDSGRNALSGSLTILQ